MKFAALALLCLGMTGCSQLNEELIGSSERFLEFIGPEYTSYVNQDQTLTESQKLNRLNRLAAHERVIQSARNLNNGSP